MNIFEGKAARYICEHKQWREQQNQPRREKKNSEGTQDGRGQYTQQAVNENAIFRLSYTDFVQHDCWLTFLNVTEKIKTKSANNMQD